MDAQLTPNKDSATKFIHLIVYFSNFSMSITYSIGISINSFFKKKSQINNEKRLGLSYVVKIQNENLA